VNGELVRRDSEETRRHAVEVLRAGGLIAFPTDTVYGVAALPWAEEPVVRLYVAKRRPRDKPIPLLLSGADQLDRVATLPEPFRPLAARFWPGGLTLLLPKKESVPAAVSAGPAVAVRVPDLSLARDLIELAGGVLAVTSANISGQASPSTACQVEEQLGRRIDLIIDGGACRGGIPSSILDCTSSPPALLRRGAVAEEDLVAIVGSIEIST
jgi:L-threonylcarbamoyladenylate synthase